MKELDKIKNNKKVIELWKKFNPKVLTREELDEIRIKAYEKIL